MEEKYDDLENDLIELSLLSEIPARINSFLTLDELSHTKENNNTVGTGKTHEKGTNTKSRWTSGIGYGHHGLAEWDIQSTEKKLWLKPPIRLSR